MTNIYDNIEPEQPDEAVLEVIGRAIKLLEETQDERRKKEDEVKQLKQKEDEILIHQLPKWMKDAGLSEVKTSDGRKVSIKAFYSPKVVDYLSFEEYLKKNSEDAILKYSFHVPLSKDDTQKSDELRDALENLGVDFTEDTEVHSMTLKKYVKEKDEAGEMNQLDSFIKINKFECAVIK